MKLTDLPAATAADNAPLCPVDHECGSLSTITIDCLKEYFTSVGHSPSPSMWEALSDQAKAMEAMANGTARPTLYLSSLDPGVGKTQTLYAFVRNLVRSPAHAGVGVLICLGRLEEVRSFVQGMSAFGSLPPTAVAVMTGDKELNALGHPVPQEAQVLVTTHQRMERMRGRRLSEAVAFFYQGRPRTVRVWDESFLPARAVVLNTNTIASLLETLSTINPDLRARIMATVNEVEGLPDNSTYSVPDFAAEFSIGLPKVIRAMGRRAPTRLKDAAADLWHLSGRTVSVRCGNRDGWALVDYRDSLPSDMAPMLILDASGRVRATYDDMEARGLLVRLQSAVKRYDNLTVHLWDKGGGKSSFALHGDELCKEVARMVLTKPQEPWLVIVHKPHPTGGDYERLIRQNLQGADVDVAFLTWGNHMATNAYVDRSNVILAGTLFYGTAQYEALKRSVADQRASDACVSAEALARVKIGETMHRLLQALCRASVRRCEGDSCPPTNAYVIGNSRHDFKGALAEAFPGAKVKAWRPEGLKLTGYVAKAIVYLSEMAPVQAGAKVRFKQVAQEIGMKPDSFNKDVRVHPIFREALSELMIIEVGGNSRATSFQFGQP
ncbi:hypothetical protein GBZ48_17800 [Azospirillum melinis]|uniref:Uncharacterized protein n=1 Tax=Azospirillum melinis TaxID=328839 RepID=A0ABX2KED4_9PROT|nr:hypothetical protein [Azospirillum melinis]MBP2304603.1 DNA polymerase III delta prime subunit [Azospirillum melinis]NUB01131.1 hypothetical protein [Azospirillum melinis]